MNKKVIVIILVLLVLIGIGGYYFITNNNGTNDKVLKTAAIDYFDKYVSVYSGTSAYNVTLKDLKEAEEDYDLKEYEGCNEDKTYVIVSIDSTNGKVIGTEIKKNC